MGTPTLPHGFYWLVPFEQYERQAVVEVDQHGVWRAGSELETPVEEVLRRALLVGPIKPPTKRKIAKKREESR